jgi:hypothetical protein
MQTRATKIAPTDAQSTVGRVIAAVVRPCTTAIARRAVANDAEDTEQGCHQVDPSRRRDLEDVRYSTWPSNTRLAS